jgi:hypothetical protein
LTERLAHRSARLAEALLHLLTVPRLLLATETAGGRLLTITRLTRRRARLTITRLATRRLTVTRLLLLRRLTVPRLLRLLRLAIARLLLRRLTVARLLRRLSVAALLRLLLRRLPVPGLLRLLLLRLLTGITGLLAVRITRGITVSAGGLVHGDRMIPFTLQLSSNSKQKIRGG